MAKAGDVKRKGLLVRCTYAALFVLTLAAAALQLESGVAHAGQASLSWTAPTTNTDGTTLTDLAGYKLHIGTASKSYQQHIDVGNLTSYLASNLTDGSTYYFAVTAYDTSGIESAYSNEVSKTLALATHTITATSGSGGNITAVGNSNYSVATSGSTTITSVKVTDGTNQSFTIAPATGYAVSSVLADGTSVGAVTSYTFSSVTADHTLGVTFAPQTYNISASAGTGGSITPSGSTTVNSGGSQSYTIAAATGYAISAVTVDGSSVGAVSSYTFSNVTANHTLSATFARQTYSISASAGTGGSITPSGSTTVNSGGSQSYTIAAATGYAISSVTVDGSSVGAVSSYTFSNVTANHTLSATFAPQTYSISASAGTGGSITPSGSTTVNYGGGQSYTIAAATGYAISAVTVDGSSMGAVSSYTFSNVTANHSIQASFAATSTSSSGSTAIFAANAGGSSYTSPAGVTYQADAKYSGGSVSSSTATITGTTEGTLYQTERYGNFSYSIPVTNGSYNVTLKFAETYFSTAGSRVFSVAVNGTTVISNLDIYSKVGKNAAYDVVVPVTVSNGTISIQFTSQVNNAELRGIKVVASTTTASPTSGTVAFASNSGGSSYTDSTGVAYKADTGYSGGSVSTSTAAISGTSDDTLYQSERYGNFSYSIPASNGNYYVTLKFAEGYFTNSGQRVFNVAVNGTTVISNLDIYAKAGANAAYDVVLPVSVSNGTIKIDFVSVINNAEIRAILVKAA